MQSHLDHAIRMTQTPDLRDLTSGDKRRKS